MGMPMIRGRWFTEAESSPAIVINESLWRRAFENLDPLGVRVTLSTLSTKDAPYVTTIVGVVADLRYRALDVTPMPEVYVAYTEVPRTPPFTIVARTTVPSAVVADLRQAVGSIDRTQLVDNVTTLDQRLAESVAPRRFNLFLLGTFAATAVMIALMGIYGLIAYSVKQRTHEIGARLAIGGVGARKQVFVAALAIVTGRRGMIST